MDEQEPRPTGPEPSEQHPTEQLPAYAADNPTRYGAPLPPPPHPAAHEHDAWSVAPRSTPPRRRSARLVALGAALAVVAVAGGAGFALGRHDHQGAASAGAPSAGYSQAPQSGSGQSPFGNASPFRGMPFVGPGQSGGSPYSSASGGTPASGSQLTGLVRIASTLKYQGGKAAGTGMILTSNGEVVTNHHVVAGSTDLRVTVMSTGRTYAATVVGTDAKDDVAVVQMTGASGLQTVTPDTDGIAVGDAVTAVGDAGGDTSSLTAAAGKIMATGQNITTRSEGSAPGERLRGLIKISSDVIAGDSGGATYDDQGEVIGMTTAASMGGRDTTGYAIPIAKVITIAGDLENGTQNARYAYGSPAFLGIGLGGSSTRVGVVYPGTPASRAGVVAGDRITRVGSTHVATSRQLRATVTTYSPGDQVSIQWTDRTGTSHVAVVTLMSGPVA